MVEMQDMKSGIKGLEQKLNVTTIPHVISGETEAHKNINKLHKNIENLHRRHNMHSVVSYIFQNFYHMVNTFRNVYILRLYKK